MAKVKLDWHEIMKWNSPDRARTVAYHACRLFFFKSRFLMEKKPTETKTVKPPFICQNAR